MLRLWWYVSPIQPFFIPFSFSSSNHVVRFFCCYFFHLRVRLYLVESWSDIYPHFPSHNLFLVLRSPMQFGLGLFISFFDIWRGWDLMTAWISFSDRPWYVDVQRDIVEGCFHDGKRGGSFCTWVRSIGLDSDGREEKRCQGWMNLDYVPFWFFNEVSEVTGERVEYFKDWWNWSWLYLRCL